MSRVWPNQMLRHTIRFILMGAGAFLAGCVTQQINFNAIPQASPATLAHSQVRHFKETTRGIYLLFDLIPVKRARLEDAMKEHNPQNKPVANLKVTSRGGWLAGLLNLGTGYVFNRGTIISLNELVVEGDVVEGPTPAPVSTPAPPDASRTQ